MGGAPLSSDKQATGLALASAILMIGHQVAGKATRDALFLSQFHVTELPKAVIVAAVLSMLAVLAMSRLLARFGPRILVPASFAVSATLFVAEWVLFGVTPQAVAVVLYMHMAIFGAILISGFWSVINERFDPHSARGTVARVAGAATLGGVLGGFLAAQVTALTDLRTMLLVLAAVHGLCVVTVLGIGAPGGAGGLDSLGRTQSGFLLLARSEYLRRMAILVALVAVMAALLDYVLKAEASARFRTGEELVAFFASFYAILGVVSFALQSGFGPRLLAHISPGRVLGVLPATVMLAGMVGLAWPGLWTVAVVRGGQAVLANSLFRTAFELLYTPLPPRRKRPTKTIIDVAADRLGDMLGGGLVLLLLAVTPAFSNQTILVFAVAIAGLVLYVVARLHQGYIAQLARTLRKGAVTADLRPVLDATTQYVLAEISPSMERRLLMERIRQMRFARTRETEESESDTAPELAAEPRPDPPPELTASATPVAVRHFSRLVGALTSKDPALIRRALDSDFVDLRLASYVIPLLANDAVAEDARTELRWQAPRVIGQLTDAMLDPDVPLAARQRIPSVLEVCYSPRAVVALAQGLEAYDFNVRYACGRALARMHGRDPGLRIPRQAVVAAVRRELHVDETTWHAHTLRISQPLPAADEGAGPSPILNRAVEHIFSLLGLVFEQEAMRLALQALGSGNRNLHGTALEYLENVLPEDIRRDLWLRLAMAAPAAASQRSALELLGELRRLAAEVGGRV